MAVEGIKKLSTVDLGSTGSIAETQPDTVKANNFNSANINPFIKEQIQQSNNGKNNVRNNSSFGLFGNGIIKEETKTAQKNELPTENKAVGIGILSNYFKNIIPTFKEVNSKVNDYDNAVNTALKYLPSKGELEIIVASNPRIKAILNEAGLPVKLNYDNLKTIKQGHVADTTRYTRAIGKELGFSNAQLQTMEVGAAMHDIGKTLIPSEILNKNGRLTQEERKTVNLHSVLGYEILKSAGFGVNVAEISRDHHNKNSKNYMAQIVRAADIYSAMTEERPYKKAKTHDEAMAVLSENNIKPEILNALDKVYGNKDKKEFTLPSRTLVAAS